MNKLSLKIYPGVRAIPAEQWQTLAGDDPFLSHSYLSALEASGSVSAETGWQARFLTLWQKEKLTAAMPLYLKHHSFGEFVFDWAWAEAYQAQGLRYYPKLLCAIPFTPVSGKRILCGNHKLARKVRTILTTAALEIAQQQGLSSLHCLFLQTEEQREMEQQGMIIRTDTQFHWHNAGYLHFDQFLAELKHSKRKRIRQERRQVQRAGITFRHLTGQQASPDDWAFFYRCYTHTRQQYHSPAALNENFFQRLGRTMRQQTLLIIAENGGRPIAAALNFFTASVLYGRSWGALEFHPGLHFETCYYQAIDFCLERGIKTFEGGAQGEHKLARGFLPVTTYSSHWLAQPQFFNAIKDYIAREGELKAKYRNDLRQRSPFRRQ